VSVYRSAKSPFYLYDFQVNGHRFFGSTKTTTKREAQDVERDLKKQAKADLEQQKRLGTGPLILDVAAGRYWEEVGKHRAGSADTWRDLERLIGYFGKDKRLDQITDADVAALVAWRRQQTIKGIKKRKDGKPVQLIAPATVNRSTTVVLKKVFSRAKRTWKYQFPLEPNWRDHWLVEPEERVRELHEHESEALYAAIRDDYAPWLEFARLTGFRRAETLIQWSAVNWTTKQIRTRGKGGKWVSTPITSEIRAILEPLKGHHHEFVFTYVCKRPLKGQTKGKRYPITPQGAKTEWRRTRARAKLVDFRFHDIRHDVATKTLRETGNLKLVQRVLNHSSIKTTTKYAHVLDGEVADALERVAKSRKNSRIKKKDVA
jgi:integrase